MEPLVPSPQPAHGQRNEYELKGVVLSRRHRLGH